MMTNSMALEKHAAFIPAREQSIPKQTSTGAQIFNPPQPTRSWPSENATWSHELLLRGIPELDSPLAD